MNSIFERSRFTHPRRILYAATVIALVACGGDSPVDPKAKEPSSLQAVSPRYFEGTVGTAADPPPTVIVKDAAGDPVAGVRVEFAVGAGGGSVSSQFVSTDNAGLASVTWILGIHIDPALSRNELWVQVPGLTPIRFKATVRPGPPARLAALAMPSDTLVGGFTSRLDVHVLDAFDNGVPDVAVAFRVTGGDGSVASASVKTNSGGFAYTDWTLGVAGENSVTATAADLPSVAFRIIALDPAAFVWYDLQQIVGSSGSVETAVIGFDESGRFVVQTAYSGSYSGYRYSAFGHYTIAGSSVVLRYATYTENAVLENNQLVIDRSDYYGTSIWTYKKRN
ncbi:MAG TPA: Ig-like domain-containing protein [Gemmatimonadaceae bacterium]|jgi:hypothetical protein